MLVCIALFVCLRRNQHPGVEDVREEELDAPLLAALQADVVREAVQVDPEHLTDQIGTPNPN